MPRLATPLSDAQVKRAKAGAKLIKLFDGHGLYLEVQPSGAKFWRFRYRQANGKETTITFGPYPEVSLADARDKRSDARRLLLEGGDPIQQREQARRESVRTIEYTFRKVATEWRDLHVLAVAEWLFRQKGYHQVSLGLIVSSAGVATRTIYASFGEKRALLDAIFARRQMASGVALAALDALEGRCEPLPQILHRLAAHAFKHALSPSLKPFGLVYCGSSLQLLSFIEKD